VTAAVVGVDALVATALGWPALVAVASERRARSPV
jgi:hypothetical protein